MEIDEFLFRKVNKMRPWSPRAMRTQFEEKVTRWSIYLIATGVGIVLIVTLSLVFWKAHCGPISKSVRNVALIVIAVALIVAFLGFFIECFPLIKKILNKEENEADALKGEMVYNEAKIISLYAFSVQDLNLVDEHLMLLLTRWDASTLLAMNAILFTILGLVWNALSELAPILGRSRFFIYHLFATSFLSMFIANWAIARRNKSYEYRRGIIATASKRIKMKSETDVGL